MYIPLVMFFEYVGNLKHMVRHEVHHSEYFIAHYTLCTQARAS